MGQVATAERIVTAKKPKAEQYTKFPAEMIRSPALRNMPQRAMCVVWATLDEHNKKGGKENGNLVVPYKTLKIWLGTSDKTAIALSIKQARALKLIAVIEGRFNKDGTREPTRFRVTWLPGHNNGPPTNDWREITTDEQAREILASLKKRRPKSPRFKTAELSGQLGTKWSDEYERVIPGRV
jgi:hypothetical protein